MQFLFFPSSAILDLSITLALRLPFPFKLGIEPYFYDAICRATRRAGEAPGKEDESWRSFGHVSKTASEHVPLYPTGTEEVSPEEIRSAAIFSDSVYPLFIHRALVSSPESDHPISVLHGRYFSSLHHYFRFIFVYFQYCYLVRRELTWLSSKKRIKRENILEDTK